MYYFRQVETLVRAVWADEAGWVSIPGEGKLVAGALLWVVEEQGSRQLRCISHSEFINTYIPANAEAQAYLERVNNAYQACQP